MSLTSIRGQLLIFSVTTVLMGIAPLASAQTDISPERRGAVVDEGNLGSAVERTVEISVDPWSADVSSGEHLLVTFAMGATWACTVFNQQDVSEPYAPRHCWGLDAGATSYDDDWAHIERADGDWVVFA